MSSHIAHEFSSDFILFTELFCINISNFISKLYYNYYHGLYNQRTTISIDHYSSVKNDEGYEFRHQYYYAVYHREV